MKTYTESEILIIAQDPYKVRAIIEQRDFFKKEATKLRNWFEKEREDETIQEKKKEDHCP